MCVCVGVCMSGCGCCGIVIFRCGRLVAYWKMCIDCSTVYYYIYI